MHADKVLSFYVMLCLMNETMEDDQDGNDDDDDNDDDHDDNDNDDDQCFGIEACITVPLFSVDCGDRVD